MQYRHKCEIIWGERMKKIKFLTNFLIHKPRVLNIIHFQVKKLRLLSKLIPINEINRPIQFNGRYCTYNDSLKTLWIND
jgi:hypothetical protein